MPELHFLHDMVVLFGAALLVIALSSRLRVPPVVGFLLTGMAAGPYGLALIDDTHAVEVFAELGIVFLLFIVGLELSPSRLQRLGRILLVGGSIQTTATIALATGAALALGYTLRESLYFSFLIALSSTAIVLKLYSERRDLETPHGEVVMGILLFQDFLIVPLLIVVPVLAGAGSTSAGEVALRFGGGLLAVGLVFGAGRYVLPHFLHLIIHTRIRELVVIGALFACLGAALITESLGFSLALGAFAAGLLIAETDYRYQVLAETAPFRDVFNSMFFISVGMLLRLDFALHHAALIVAVGSAVIAIKALPALLAVKTLAFPPRTCLIAALGLAQISEFSFVLIQAGQGYGLLDEHHYQLAIAASVFTMLLTPLWVALAPRLARRFFGAEGAAPQVEELRLHRPPQVVIFGFGPNGRHLARVLKLEDIPYRIVDINGRTVRQALAEGEPILFGDSTRREIQEKAGIEEAHIGVFAISDRTALRDNVRLARALNPGLFIIARTRYLSEFADLRQCGADAVVAEEFGSSAEILRSVLMHLHLPGNVIRTEIHRLRQEAYPGSHAGPAPAPALAPKPHRIDTFLLQPEHGAAGQSLADLGLHRHSGVRVVAQMRGDEIAAPPDENTRLAAGDVLVLAGPHEGVEQAFRLLENAPAEQA